MLLVPPEVQHGFPAVLTCQWLHNTNDKNVTFKHISSSRQVLETSYNVSGSVELVVRPLSGQISRLQHMKKQSVSELSVQFMEVKQTDGGWYWCEVEVIPKNRRISELKQLNVKCK